MKSKCKRVYREVRLSCCLLSLLVAVSCGGFGASNSTLPPSQPPTPPPVSTNGNTYTTQFPAIENPISENGHWTNGEAIGLDWSNIATTSGLTFGLESGTDGYDDSTALLTGTWGANQSVQATVHTVNQPTNSNVFEEVELRLRSTLSAHSAKGYEINFRCSKSSNAYTQIVRWNGPLGDFTILNGQGGAQFGVANGDVVKAAIVGNVITVFINGVQVNQVTDNTYTNGNPGMGFFLQGTTGLNRDYGFTSFTATDQL